MIDLALACLSGEVDGVREAWRAFIAANLEKGGREQEGRVARVRLAVSDGTVVVPGWLGATWCHTDGDPREIVEDWIEETIQQYPGAGFAVSLAPNEPKVSGGGWIAWPGEGPAEGHMFTRASMEQVRTVAGDRPRPMTNAEAALSLAIGLSPGATVALAAHARRRSLGRRLDRGAATGVGSKPRM